MGATHASHGLAREGQPRAVSRRRPAQPGLRAVPKTPFPSEAPPAPGFPFGRVEKWRGGDRRLACLLPDLSVPVPV